MSSSRDRTKASLQRRRGLLCRVLSAIIVAALALPISQAQAEAVSEQAMKTVSSITAFLRHTISPSNAKRRLEPQSGPANATQVKHLRLCPRRLVLYVGEAITLVPLPLDVNEQPVQGVALSWTAANAVVATVSPWGEVSAIAPGLAAVTVQAGSVQATVTVEVRPGARLKESDAVWDLEHSGDCLTPETSQLNQTRPELAYRTHEVGQVHSVAGKTNDSSSTSNFVGGGRMKHADVKVLDGSASASPGQSVHPAVLKVTSSRSRQLPYAFLSEPVAATTARTVSRVGGLQSSGPGLIDGSNPDPAPATAASKPLNGVGSPRFGAVEFSQGSSAKTKNVLGSYDYVFSAPVLDLPGRGLDVNLALTYNSRVWSKEATGMVFNYGKGWPAAGWTLGYGRLIDNYDGVGNWLLIQADGTRTHLQQTQTGAFSSTDGTFLSLVQSTMMNAKLRYPDGTLVRYEVVNNRWLPTSIRTRNGDQITIAYKQFVKNNPDPSQNFPFRWAIDQISDTLGRHICFSYDVTTGYLTSIMGPDQAGATRTLVQIDYQTITLQYNFNSVDPSTPASPSQLAVVKRIYYPATGRGYLFPDYSSYGMSRYISVRNNMTGAGSSVTDGTEIAYTKYNYVDVSNQSGALNDSPQYTTRSEWWQGKIDDPTPTVYTYSRTTATDPSTLGQIEIDKVSYPNGMDMITTSGIDQTNDPAGFGHVLKTEIKTGTTTLRSNQPSYVTDSSGGQQISQIMATDEAGNTSKTTYDYGNYGRVANIYEYGFSTSIQRQTTFAYAGTPLVDANLLQVVKQIDVFDGAGTNVARTAFTLDDYAAKGGMQTYTTMPPPQTHDSTFDQNNTTRGNVTGVTTWVKFGATPADDVKITRNSKFDVFGNVVQADVSCCQVKNINYLDGSGSPATYYSQPLSVTDGTPNVAPFLTTSYQYDFNTGLVVNTTDPNGLTTSFSYDSAWRLKTVTAPQNAFTVTTQFDKDNNGNDQLAYAGQTSYTDTDALCKVVNNKSWFDGGGRVIRSGNGAGSCASPSPSSFDTVATVYDSLGRVLKQSNPYSGDSSGNAGTGVTLYWTQNTYDLLSRVTTVTLPDTQTIQTAYNGTIVTVTDQVGRQRQSQTDGLGRLTSVTEMNPATGLLDPTNYQTTYTYDLLNNLTGVNQGNQTRSFTYDALSRMTSQTTPEGGAVSFTYTDFGAVLKRTDPRTVETHSHYDSLNRVDKMWYTGPNGSDDPSATRPPLPSGVASTLDVSLTYNNFTTAQPGNGQLNSITDGTGSESYAYDTLARVQSKTRVIDSRSYQTQYQYNQAGQLALMIYPSGKRVRMNRDGRGRLSGEDNVDNSNNVLTSYISSIGYNQAGQVTGSSLGNGVNEAYGYSADRLQLTSQTATAGATSLINVQYIYQAPLGYSGTLTTAGNSGQLIQISGTIGPQSRTQTFTYDDLGRLATANGKGLWGRRFVYDRWGNRTSVYDATSGGNLIQSVTLEQAGGVPTNRIASVGVANYSYDLIGNLTADGTHTYQYDAASRMVSVDSGSTTSSAYDSANRRVKKVAGGVTAHYVWEGSQVIAEYDGNTGALISEYVFAGSRMVEREQSGVVRYFLQDRLSTRVITDGSGTLVGREDHLPFGEDSGTGSGETEKHRFTSYERDSETGSDYAINRQYQNTNGRFMQPDPIGGSLDNPQSINRYDYALNDPVNLADPTGLTSCYIDWSPAPCSVAFGLLQSGAGVVYNGSSIQNINGQLTPISFDANGNAFSYIRTSGPSARSGMIAGYDPNGDPIYVIGVTEKTIRIDIPFAALPIGLRYQLDPGSVVRSEGIQTDWTAQLLIGAGIGGVISRLASIGGGAANSAAQKVVDITFKHGARHLEGTGLSEAAVQNAITQDVQQIVMHSSSTGWFWGRVTVDGTTIEYRAFTLPNGIINVGTYTIRR